LLSHGGRQVLAAVAAGLGVMAAVAWRRRSRLLSWLSLLTPITLAVAPVAAMRIIGPYFGYLFLWCQVLVLPALIGSTAFGLSWITERMSTSSRRRLIPQALAIVATAATASVAMRVVARGDRISFADSPDARAVASRLEQIVGSKDRPFTVDVVQSQFADSATILQLAKDGYRFRVEPPASLYSGTSSSPPVGPTFELQSAGPPTPGPLTGTDILTVGSLDVWRR
jgi:hypothetical protein